MQNYVILYCRKVHRGKKQYKRKALLVFHLKTGCADDPTVLHYKIRFCGFWTVRFTAGKLVAEVAVDILSVTAMHLGCVLSNLKFARFIPRIYISICNFFK